MVDLLRHGRQIRLREVGVAGQERLASRAVALGGAGIAGDVERAYLEAAGAEIAPRAGEATLPEVWTALALSQPGAREVGEGALRALVTFRDAVLGERGEGDA